MASSIIELYVDVPADRQANIFGQFDEHLKLIERTLNVTMIFRDGSLKILGSQEGATQARAIVEELNTLAGRGNTITQQNVNYALSLAMEKIGSVMEEIDKDFICNTIQGRPIKPKTLGQKDYVEQIRKKMIVFGVGNWDFFREISRVRSIRIFVPCMMHFIRSWGQTALQKIWKKA